MKTETELRELAERVMGGRVDMAQVDDEAAARAFVAGARSNVVAMGRR